MANRYWYKNAYSFEVDSVTLWGQFDVGASGAVTSGTVKGGGILSVVKEATAGQYTITLVDRYSRLLSVGAEVVNATLTSTASVSLLATPATYQASFKSAGAIVIQLADYAGSAVDAPSGARVIVKIVCRNSSVSPFFG